MALRVMNLELSVELTPEEGQVLMAMMQNPLGDPDEEMPIERAVREKIFEPLHTYFVKGSGR